MPKAAPPSSSFKNPDFLKNAAIMAAVVFFVLMYFFSFSLIFSLIISCAAGGVGAHALQSNQPSAPSSPEVAPIKPHLPPSSLPAENAGQTPRRYADVVTSQPAAPKAATADDVQKDENDPRHKV